MADPEAAVQETAEEKHPVVYVNYAGTCLSMDEKGVVISNSSAEPEGIPYITGMEFTEIVFGKKAVAENMAGLEYVLRVAADLEKNGIKADKIVFSSGTVTLVRGELQLKLGRNEKTDSKIKDLADLLPQVDGKRGVLYMQNGDADNYGYTFREN